MAARGLRERKNERTRAAITRAALQLASEVGFEHATVAQIAERADVSPRTVHAWFPSKEDIVVGAAGAAVVERLSAELAASGGDVLDRIHRWIGKEPAMHTEPDDLMRLRHQVLLGDPHLRALQRSRQEGAEQLIATEIARETGLAPDALAPRALAGAIITSFLAMQQDYAREGRAGEEGFARVMPMLRAALDALHAGD